MIQDGSRTHVPTVPIEAVDATGAGDLFAAAFLHGLVQGRDAEQCARMGCVTAAEIISHIGARPEVEIEFHVIVPGLLMEDDKFQLCAFPVHHRGPDCFGF